jgi:hypothetical protein
MSDHEDDFEDAIEGPASQVELTDENDNDSETEFDEEAELKRFDDENDRQEALRQSQHATEKDYNYKGDKIDVDEYKEENIEIADDGHERSMEEASKAKAEGNECV